MVRTPSRDKISGLKKGTWTPEEDKKLIDYVTNYGHWNWRQLPKYAGLARCGKSCRLRWMNYLRPGIKRRSFTPQEEDLILNLHQRLGNRWSIIASHLPGRSDNEIKNHWNTHFKKRFKHNSSEKDEPSKSKENHSRPEEELVEITCSFQNNSLDNVVASAPFQETSLGDILYATQAPRGGNLVIEDFANFLDISTDPIYAYNSWTALNVADISYFPNELLLPFVSEPESFYPVYNGYIWDLSQ